MTDEQKRDYVEQCPKKLMKPYKKEDRQAAWSHDSDTVETGAPGFGRSALSYSATVFPTSSRF